MNDNQTRQRGIMTPKEAAKELSAKWKITSYQEWGLRERELPSFVVKDFNSRLEKAFLAGAEWANENPQWVSTKDRLPEEEKEFFLVVENELVADEDKCQSVYTPVGYFDKTRKRFYGTNISPDLGDIVTHWLPFPKGPKVPSDD